MAFLQTKHLWVKRLTDGVAELVLDVPDAKANHLEVPVLLDLETALQDLEQDEQFRVLLLTTGKAASFASGLEPRALAQISVDDFAELVEAGQRLLNKLAASRLISVAVISGTCLGGGLDLALACDYRVGVLRPSTILGFPEVEMGLIPCWGGTQRLPRVIGLERALHMLVGGKRLSAAEALAWGLVDDIAQEGDTQPPRFLANPRKHQAKGLPLRTWRQKLAESNGLGRWLIFRGFERLLQRRVADNMPAASMALEAVRTGLRQGIAAGLAEERTTAETLFDTFTCRNLLYLHVRRDELRQAAAKRDGGTRFRTLGVVGAGSRGAALIYLAITRGFQVVVREASDMALGYALMRLLALFQQEAARGAIGPVDARKQLNNIRGTSAWKGFDELDLVLDATADDVAKKRALFQEMEEHVGRGALLVTTSPRPLSVLSEGMKSPERLACLHFLPPVSRSLLVEVVVRESAPPEAKRQLSDFVTALGRIPQVTPDLPGLLVYRFLLPYFNEAILLLKEGFHPERVDDAMTGFGMVHGPLEHMDLIGMDVVSALLQDMRAELQPRLPLQPLFAWMVQERWLGQKSGKGFYHYGQRKPKVHWKPIYRLREEGRAEGRLSASASSVADQKNKIRERLVWLMVNEAARCLEEGRAMPSEALDFALTLAGWAPHRRGPLYYARATGLPAVRETLQRLAKRHGPRYAPCDVLLTGSI